MSGLRISMLGGFAVLRDGVTLIDGRWPRKKPAALLKLLALNPRRRVPRARAIDVLWPEADEESGANNLSKALHYIRAELGESANAVRSEQSAVVLDAAVEGVLGAEGVDFINGIIPPSARYHQPSTMMETDDLDDEDDDDPPF